MARESAPPKPGAQVRPLEGIKVVELGQNLSAPFAAEVLAMLGAEVFKIERPEGDDARGWGPPFPLGSSTSFNANNRGKHSIALDLKQGSQAAWLKEFLTDCDVFIHNLRPGAAEALGFGSDDLLASNPRLVYCYLSAFGTQGPLKDKPGYEVVVQAFSGLWEINGWEDGPPSRIGVPILDLGSGLWAALGCMAALHRRSATGRGGTVTGSLFETSLAFQRNVVAGFSATGQLPERSQSGGKKVVIYSSFQASDGPLLIASSNNRLFAKLARALGRKEWAEDERFKNNAGRLAQRDYLLSETAKIISQNPVQHWMQIFEAAGVPCSPVQNISQVLDHPQTQALGIIDSVPGEQMKLVGLPISFDGIRPTGERFAPAVGEHNMEYQVPTAGSEPK